MSELGLYPAVPKVNIFLTTKATTERMKDIYFAYSRLHKQS